MKSEAWRPGRKNLENPMAIVNDPTPFIKGRNLTWYIFTFLSYLFCIYITPIN